MPPRPASWLRCSKSRPGFRVRSRTGFTAMPAACIRRRLARPSSGCRKPASAFWIPSAAAARCWSRPWPPGARPPAWMPAPWPCSSLRCARPCSTRLVANDWSWRRARSRCKLPSAPASVCDPRFHPGRAARTSVFPRMWRSNFSGCASFWANPTRMRSAMRCAPASRPSW